MGEVINLNKARKAQAKAQKSLSAAQNRTLFGLSMQMRKTELQKRETRDRQHDGHRLDDRKKDTNSE
ncbi:MAG: DUF4169 family protein [Asticcacaulis sp.]